MMSTMEEISLRFPLVFKKMVGHLDDKTLTTFKEAGRITNNVLVSERFYWIRIIQKNYPLIGNFEETWRKVVYRTPAGLVKEFALTVDRFPMFIKNQCGNDTLLPIEFVQKVLRYWHPMAIGAVCGSETLCFQLMEKLGGKQVWRKFLGIPLHLAAEDSDVVRRVMAKIVRFINVKIAATYIPNHSEIEVRFYN